MARNLTTMHALDNVIWKALTTSQAQFSESSKLARKFPADVTSLGALLEPTREAYDSLAGLMTPGAGIGLVLEAPPQVPEGWTTVATLPLLQMVLADAKASLSTPAAPANGWIELNQSDVPEMMALAALTKPGPFGQRTRELGTYLGIRQSGNLVAMAGERLRLPGYTEVSAICTHPDHVGRGYARVLITELVEQICNRNEVPFLHVRADNLRAIGLYEHLGFTQRALLQFAVIRRNAQ
jgi:predicted GNAT family acetyltransferase